MFDIYIKPQIYIKCHKVLNGNRPEAYGDFGTIQKY